MYMYILIIYANYPNSVSSKIKKKLHVEYEFRLEYFLSLRSRGLIYDIP